MSLSKVTIWIGSRLSVCLLLATAISSFAADTGGPAPQGGAVNDGTVGPAPDPLNRGPSATNRPGMGTTNDINGNSVRDAGGAMASPSPVPTRRQLPIVTPTGAASPLPGAYR